MDISEIKDSNYTIKSEQDADFVINVLKNQLEFYKSKNAECNNVLSKLKLTQDSLSFTSRDTLDKLAKLQEASGVNKLDLVDIQMSYLDCATRQYYYQNQSNNLKGHLEDLQQMTADIIQETQNAKKEIIQSKQHLDKIAPISEVEIQKLKLQVESYEDRLLQYINKYPWLKEPEYNLLSIQEEIKKIYRLQDEIKGLEKEVERYCGLKPDLFTAKTQLAKIKAEYENLAKLISEKDCSK